MKIPSPQELSRQEATDVAPEVACIVATITEKMSPPVGGRRLVDIAVSDRLRAAVNAKFAAAGWTLKYWDSQIDGQSVEVLPLRKGGE